MNLNVFDMFQSFVFVFVVNTLLIAVVVVVVIASHLNPKILP